MSQQSIINTCCKCNKIWQSGIKELWCKDCTGSVGLKEGIKHVVEEFARKVQQCDFCYGTGEHLCPDVPQPILIKCTKKGCPFVK